MAAEVIDRHSDASDGDASAVHADACEDAYVDGVDDGMEAVVPC